MLIIFLISITFAQNTQLKNFHEAKKYLFEIHGEQGKTIYCGCLYDKNKISHKECGYLYSKLKKRSTQLEWEHIVPANAFGQSFLTWRAGHEQCKSKRKSYKGRRCTQKIEALFKFMEADLYNLYPAVGSINQMRSNYSMAEIAGDSGKIFGACPVKIADRKIEPPAHVKGDIARIYFYMNQAYPNRGIISNKNQKLFEAWSKLDPVDQSECEKNYKIEQIQKNSNSFVKDECLKIYPAIFKPSEKVSTKSGKAIN